MRGLILSLVLLVFLFPLGFCAQESYPRPWENEGWVAQNEHIADLGFTEIWFLMKPTANVSQMDAMGLMLPFHDSLQESQVESLFSECTQRNCSGIGPMGSAVRYKQFADEVIHYTRLSQSSPGAMFDVYQDSMYAWNLYHYVQNWKGAMGNALLAAEETGAEVNGKRALAEQYRGIIETSGICDADYAGPNSGICTGAIEDAYCNSTGLWYSIPDMRWYPGCMREEWAVSSLLDARYENMSHGFNEAIDQLDALGYETDAGKEMADGAMQELRLNELNRITISAQSTDVGGVSSIKGEYSRINEEYAEANSLFANANRDSGYRGADWYKTRYARLLSASAAYDDVVGSADEVMAEAQDVVERQEALAEADLLDAERVSGTLTQNGGQHLELAREACAFADAETALGIKFEKYGECRMHARIAAINSETEDSSRIETTAAESEALIRKAETDGIDASSEKALLGIVRERKPASSLSILARIKDGILQKAAQKYYSLPEQRENLLRMINGGGPQLAFLGTWLEGEECYSGDSLDYECAIGSLSSMEESYDRINEEILLRADEVVGNTLMVEYYETSTGASLREESEYHLVISARNTLGIGAENVVFEVPAGAELRKIDIYGGGELVRAVSYQDGVAAIQISSIGPGEELTIAFSKNYTPCMVSSRTTDAVGMLDGDAKVTEKIALKCTVDVESIEVGEGIGEARLDGSDYYVSDGILRARLAVGEHELELTKTVADAYSITKGGETATTIGAKTTAEYMLEIKPQIDLEYIPVIIDESPKNPTKLDVFAYTGERITNKKEYGSGTMYLEINGLEGGEPAKMRVRYEFVDAKGYVETGIASLSDDDLGEAAESYLGNASALYASGDYDAALTALESARAQMDKDAKERSKIMAKDQELRDEVERKLAGLQAAIKTAEAHGLDGQYVNEMRARVEYLQEMLSRNLSSSSTVSPLEDVDLGWEGKEITKIQKYLKDSEAKIKKDWMALGVDDANMSSAVMAMEEENAFFSGTMRLEDATEALSAMENAQAALNELRGRYDAESAGEKTALHVEVDGAMETLAKYEDERNSVPRGNPMASIFAKSPSWIRNRLASLNKSDDVDAAISEVSSLNGEMEGVIKVLKGESERIGATVEDLYEEAGDSLGEESKTIVEQSIESAEGYHNQGHYVKAVLAYEGALAAMEGSNEGDLNLLILAATALLIIGIVAVLLLRGGRPPFVGRPEKKHVKKLEKIRAEDDAE